jgi:GDP-4-dehydro-6-deoxy-D-mannose reductase
MRILITGATGFVGAHLAEALLARGSAEVNGLSRTAQWPPECAHLAGRVRLHPADLAATTDLTAVLAAVRPAWVFHLAGYAHPGKSAASREEADKSWQANDGGTRNLMAAMKSAAVRPRVLFVSTGQVYGDAEGACAEDHSLHPASPYAESKVAAERFLAECGPDADVLRVRPFNQIGPRQSPEYAVARFASQIAAVERGELPDMETGDLSSHRDLTDVRDMVQAYIRLLENGRAGEVYNAGAGHAVLMQDVLDRLLRLAQVQVAVRSRRDPRRPAEKNVTFADTSKLRGETGWQPRIPLDQTLADTLNYWRNRPRNTDHGPRTNR